MQTTPSAQIGKFNALLEKSIKANWNEKALSDYQGSTLQYRDVARKIVKLHIIYEQAGIRPGDKIALCGRNGALWGCVFLSVITYGAVIVPIQNVFTTEQITHIVNHSDARLLLADRNILKQLKFDDMPQLLGTGTLDELELADSRSAALTEARQRLNEFFGLRYPKTFGAEDIRFHVDEPEETALINYTSGTTGFSKGVMLPYRSLWSNMDFLMEEIGSHLPPHAVILAFLPMAHMYGLTCDFLLQVCLGNHLYFLQRPPSPSIVQEAFAQLRPHLIVSVPLVLEKIVRQEIMPIVKTRQTQLLMRMPRIGNIIKRRLCQRLKALLGGQFYEVIIGGASLSTEVENLLRWMEFPLTVGYGMTETGPMISLCDHTLFVPQACGLPAKHMEVRILSDDPEHIPGELVTRGANLLTGYYKNPEATAEAIDAEGWLHTGDLARMAPSGHIFIVGRIKNMLLGSNGQNIYPEEIEDKLGSLLMVKEGIVLQKGQKLVALVVPDMEQAESLGVQNTLDEVMRNNLKELNALLPKYCHVSDIKMHDKEFERTSKGSIKRYLYKEQV